MYRTPDQPAAWPEAAQANDRPRLAEIPPALRPPEAPVAPAQAYGGRRQHVNVVVDDRRLLDSYGREVELCDTMRLPEHRHDPVTALNHLLSLPSGQLLTRADIDRLDPEQAGRLYMAVQWLANASIGVRFRRGRTAMSPQAGWYLAPNYYFRDERPVPAAEDQEIDLSQPIDLDEAADQPLVDEEPVTTESYADPYNRERISELCQAIEAGVLADERLLAGVDGPVEQADLLTLKILGQQAYEIMISLNAGLVRWQANRFKDLAMPFEDRVQAGMMGLEIAIQKYDYRRGYRFSTYATWWIRQSMSREAINGYHAIRRPDHIYALDGKVGTQRHRLTVRLQRPPTVAELAAAVDSSPAKVVAALARIDQPVISYDAALHHDSSAPLSDRLLPQFDVDPLHDLEMARYFDEAELTARERYIIAYGYGFVDGKAWNDRQLARHFGWTVPLVRDSRQRALDKLRQVIDSRD